MLRLPAHGLHALPMHQRFGYCVPAMHNLCSWHVRGLSLRWRHHLRLPDPQPPLLRLGHLQPHTQPLPRLPLRLRRPLLQRLPTDVPRLRPRSDPCQLGLRRLPRRTALRVQRQPLPARLLRSRKPAHLEFQPLNRWRLRAVPEPVPRLLRHPRARALRRRRRARPWRARLRRPGLAECPAEAYAVSYPLLPLSQCVPSQDDPLLAATASTQQALIYAVASDRLYMAFVKTPKRIRNGIFSVYYKIGLKIESYKKIENSIFFPTSHFWLSSRLPGIEPWYTAIGSWVYDFQSP